MADPFVANGGRVDVARVMEALREGIRRRRDEALFDGTPAEETVARRLKALADEAGLDGELLERLLRDDPRWNLNPDYRIETHRTGLSKALVVGLKRLVRPLVRLYTDPIVERQRQLNLYLLHVVLALLDETTRLHQALAKLKER
ncbi:MAG TPA: hypothetical protein VFM88_03610 [Vicinamibacteria bacterium]|nr:hypothetical protein [Vicinamibacteria bacterium]